MHNKNFISFIVGFLILNVICPGFLSSEKIQFFTLLFMVLSFIIILFLLLKNNLFFLKNKSMTNQQIEIYKWLSIDIYIQVIMLFLSVLFYSFYSFKTYDFSFVNNDAFPLLILSAGLTGIYNYIKLRVVYKLDLSRQQVINLIITILYGLLFTVIALFFKPSVENWYNGIFGNHLFKYKYNYYSEIWFLHFVMTVYAIFCISDTLVALSKAEVDRQQNRSKP